MSSQQKKVIINGSWYGSRMVGVNRYASSIMEQMDHLLSDKENILQITLLVPRDHGSENIPELKNVKVVKKGWCGRPGTFSYKVLSRLWTQILMPSYCSLHTGSGVDMTLALPTFGIKIYAIHDCIREVYYAEEHSRYQRSYIRRVKNAVSKKNCEIVTVSQLSKQDLMRFYGIGEERIHVIGNGWEHTIKMKEDPAILQHLGLNNGTKYCFGLGDKAEHKNLKWTINVARHNPEYVFVITGRDLGVDYGIIPENVMMTGYLSDAEIKALYKNCSLFLAPSFYEGFGIPPLEALSMGAPVAVSNCSCFPEIYGNSVRYFDPNKYDYRIDDLISQPVDESEDVLNKHTWVNAGRQMYELLKKL